MNYDNYDTLLGISNPELRKQMGVWYTPKEIVTYMVKGVDQILSTYFHLSLQSDDVVLLDPATGTGTFISEVIKYGKTTNITAIEILEESYNIAQSKLPKTIKLIHGNTLELNEEAVMVRQEQPVMVVLGNPPYNGNSKNQGKFINDLMVDYKADFKVSGALNDDYIKFIRYAQNLIDQNGSGVVAYISNNSFLSSVAMTNMRKSILKSFDEIFIINFTFDEKDTYEKVKDRIFETVKTPVCIYFFLKTGKKASSENGKVFFKDFKGTRSDKFKYLQNSILNKDFKEIELLEPEYYFYPLDGKLKDEYTKDSFALDECLNVKGSGVKTNCDPLVFDTKHSRLTTKIDAYFTKGELSGASDTVNDRKTKRCVTKKEDGVFINLPYRPFDTRGYFDSKLTETRSEKLRKHEQAENQIFLAFKSTCWDKNSFNHTLIYNTVGDFNYFAHGTSYYAPLYQYKEATPLVPASQITNFTTDFLNEFGKAISKSHQDDPTLTTDQTFSSLDAMDYIYGVLNDKAYTTKYNQFLKSNYPRVPYPKSIATFISYKDAGSKLRSVHLDDTTQDSKSTYNATTNNKIEKVTFSNNKLYFNKSSFFDNITQDMFDFKVGASQPLKNWLESRKEDSFDESMVEQFLNVIYKVRNSI